MFWLKRIFLILLIVAVLVGGLYVIGEGFVASSNIREMAEKAFGNILKARVTIGTAHLAFLNEVVLSGLKLEQEDKSGEFVVADIGRIVFRYSIFDLFMKKFSAPQDVRLDSPHFVVNSIFFPAGMFGGFLGHVKGGILPGNFSVRRGGLKLVSSRWNLSLALTDIKTDVRARAKDTIDIVAEARPAGDKNGKIRIVGEAAPLQNAYDINCAIDHASWKGTPVRDMTGQIWFKDGRLIIQNLTFLFNNIHVSVQGVVHNILTAPELDLTFEIQERDIQTLVSLKGPYKEAALKGTLNFLGFAYAFDGIFNPTAGGFAFNNMLLNGSYNARGDVDFLTSTLRAHVEKDLQRIDVELNIQDFDIDLNLKLDHMKFMDNDIVTSARLRLKPHESFWESNRLQFKTTLDSDYLIFNYEVLDDFKGKFLLSFKEVQDIEFRWGDSYRLIGRANLQKPFIVDLKLAFNNADIQKIRNIGDAAIPSQLASGKANGEVKIRGELAEPELDVYCVARDGFLGDLSFDQLTIRCYGNKYYLRLKDSKLRVKGNDFDVKGDIDFKKDNIFEGVQITTMDHVVLWQGWDLVKKAGEDGLTIGKSIGNKLRMDFQSVLSDDKSNSRDIPDSAAGMEYEFQKGKSIRVKAEENKDEEYLTVGPKFKF